MERDVLTREELIEFAVLVFGDAWRDRLAEHIGISRTELVLSLAAGNPVPDAIADTVVTLVDQHLRERESDIRQIEERLTRIKEKTSGGGPRRTTRKSAS